MNDDERVGVTGANESAAPGPVLPAEQVFLPDDVDRAEPVEFAGAVRPVASRRPGPGIWESLAWMVGVYVVQVIAGLAAAAVLAVAFVATTGVEELTNLLSTPAGVQTIMS